jgi:predicted nucleic acid-binding protein
MILYLDTSALVKKYFEEEHSTDVISAWQTSLEIATSAVAYAEMLAAVYRKVLEMRVKKPLLENVLSVFQKDWSSFIIVGVDNSLNETLHKIIVRYGLRGFDAIHLASALTIGSVVADDYVFACYDERLNDAARGEGLKIL